MHMLTMVKTKSNWSVKTELAVDSKPLLVLLRRLTSKIFIVPCSRAMPGIG